MSAYDFFDHWGELACGLAGLNIYLDPAGNLRSLEISYNGNNSHTDRNSTRIDAGDFAYIMGIKTDIIGDEPVISLTGAWNGTAQPRFRSWVKQLVGPEGRLIDKRTHVNVMYL